MTENPDDDDETLTKELQTSGTFGGASSLSASKQASVMTDELIS